MTPEQEAQLKQFNQERNEALLSMDEQRIRAFVKKWNGVDSPSHPEAFWGGVHKCITGTTTLPIEFRRKSYQWLPERGYGTLDDGDLKT